MEKESAGDRRRSWQSERNIAQDEFTDSSRASCCQAAIWPCGYYSEAWRLVNASHAGRSVMTLPEASCCNSKCVRYVICFPFYGFLNAKLQGMARALYGINGNDVKDCWDGCCCPCITLPRIQREIILRESQIQRSHQLKQSQTIHETELPNLEKYKSLPPMSIKRVSFGDQDSMRKSSMAKDFGGSRKPSVQQATRIDREDDGARSSPRPATVAESSGQDDAVPSSAASLCRHSLPSLNFLDQQWILVPANEGSKTTSREHVEDISIEEDRTASLRSNGSGDDEELVEDGDTIRSAPLEEPQHESNPEVQASDEEEVYDRKPSAEIVASETVVSNSAGHEKDSPAPIKDPVPDPTISSTAQLDDDHPVDPREVLPVVTSDHSQGLDKDQGTAANDSPKEKEQLPATAPKKASRALARLHELEAHSDSYYKMPGGLPHFGTDGWHPQ